MYFSTTSDGFNFLYVHGKMYVCTISVIGPGRLPTGGGVISDVCEESSVQHDEGHGL